MAAIVAGSAHSPVAQLAEHPTVNRRVTGSSPVGGATCSPVFPGRLDPKTGEPAAEQLDLFGEATQ